MRGDKRLETVWFRRKRIGLFALICVSMLAAGCSKSEDSDTVLDTSRLPRVSGAKEIYASPVTTIFTSPVSVVQTAETVDKALAAAGWQKYVAPFTSVSATASQRTLSLKKGKLALGVFITVAPAQGNATSVQYNVVPLKTDLPFVKDASNIEYSPDRPLLSLITAEPVDKTLDFYRKELSERGWSLWSTKLNAKQAPGGASGEPTDHGAYAHYVNDKEPKVTLTLTVQRAEASKFKVELKEWPIGVLASAHKALANTDSGVTPPLEIGKLPRLAGATEDTGRSSPDRLVYSVAGKLAATRAALTTLLANDGWTPYVAPLEPTHATSMTLKKGRQGLSVSFTIQVGKNEQTSELTTVYYSPTRLQFGLPVPADATDVVFDDRRPYLNCVTGGAVEAALDFFSKGLTASGWTPLSAKDAAAHWPGATLDATAANGAVAYFDRGNERPVRLSLQRRRDGKIDAEIKVAPFALPQALEAGDEMFGLPKPKLIKSASATGGKTEHALTATVPATIGTVLAFYRRELAARGWTEQNQGAVLNADEPTLTFSAPQGTAVLKLGHKFDLTTVSLVLHLPKAAVKQAPAAQADSIDAMLKQAQQMVRDATADAKIGGTSPKAAQAPNGPEPALRPRAQNPTPLPVPDSAKDVDFDGAGGRLEFSSASSVKAMADFYRSAMKGQGWAAGSSVINNANMVVLNFTKAGKSVMFTIMRMGSATNVSANGSALKVAAAVAAKAPVQASADDLIAEESGGLPVPKRHTMSESTKTPFRRDLTASVPLELKDVLGFYRRELGKLKWTEAGKRAADTPDSAVIAYTSPEGPAVLKLGRKDDATSVQLIVKNPDAARKAGVLPQPGKARVLFGNINKAEAAITFNKKTFKVAAGAGTKRPDGPTLDLPPGKYRYSLKLPGRPSQSDVVTVGADETWGLMIGPGGVLPLQAY